ALPLYPPQSRRKRGQERPQIVRGRVLPRHEDAFVALGRDDHEIGRRTTAADATAGSGRPPAAAGAASVAAAPRPAGALAHAVPAAPGGSAARTGASAADRRPC